MKLFNSNYELLKRSTPAKMGKRFVCCVIDMAIVFLVAAAIFMGAFAITENSASYKKASLTIREEITYFENDVMSETHLLEFIDGERAYDEVVSYINLLKAVKVSLENNGKDFSSFYEKIEEKDLEEVKLMLAEIDDITHFYTVYLPTYDKDGKIVNMGDTEPMTYLHSYYYNSFGDQYYYDLFGQREQNPTSTPVLRSDVAEKLFHYITVSTDDPMGKEGATYYDIFTKGYTSMVSKSIEKVVVSEPYYSNHYVVYRSAMCDKGRMTNLALIISVFLAYCIVVVLPKFLFKNEVSIGYKIFGLGVIKMTGETNPWYIKLIKLVPEFFGFLIIIFFMYLLPPFEGVYDAMFLSFTFNSFLSLGGLILIIAIIGVINNSFGLFTHFRQTLINIIFKDVVVDTKYLDEGDRDEVYEGRPY